MAPTRRGHRIPNAPSRAIYIVSLILGIVGVVLHFRLVAYPPLQPHAFVIELAAFILLVIGTTFDGI
jgi:hypothetical protein